VKLNLVVDDIYKQPHVDLETIKETLDARFEYLDHPLTFKYVKDKVVMSFKTRVQLFCLMLQFLFRNFPPNFATPIFTPSQEASQVLLL
jgi:hypothetical protein